MNKMIIQLVTFLVLLHYSVAQIGCPAINCPANCDVVNGPNGCNHCACPQGTGEQNVCAAVPTCPQGCRQDVGEDGCPVCQCGHNGILCAAVASCLKGCLNHNNVTGCYTCGCFPSPLPGASSRSLEIGSTGSSANSRQRRQLRQPPPLRRIRPNFTPGGVQFRTTQLPFRNRRPVFSSGSFSAAGSRCQPVNCQQGCRTVIDLYGCRQCICGQGNVFCPSVPACYGRCIRNNPNTGCSECTCSLAGISTIRHQASSHNIVAQQNGAHILPSTSVLHQNANVSPNLQATQTNAGIPAHSHLASTHNIVAQQNGAHTLPSASVLHHNANVSPHLQATQPNGRPPSTIGFNTPTSSNTHLRPTSNAFIPHNSALNHRVNVNENVPLGQHASTFSQVPAVQQGFANPGAQQQRIPNVHLSHFQPGSSIQHTLLNQHVTTNTGSVPLTSPLGNPVPIPQNQHLVNSASVQDTSINSTPALHGTVIQHVLPNQHLHTNTAIIPGTSSGQIQSTSSEKHVQTHNVGLVGHLNIANHASVPNQHLPTNTAIIPGTSSGQIQSTFSEKHVQIQNVGPVGHLNPTNHASVQNQHLPVNTAVVSGATSSQIIPLGDPGSIQYTHHFQNSVPVETINVDPFLVQHNPIVQQEGTNIALNPGKALNIVPLKPTIGAGPILQISEDESAVPVKHLKHANPLIQASIFSPTNKPTMLSHSQDALPPNVLPELSHPVIHLPSNILIHTDSTTQRELLHPVKLPKPHKVFPSKVLPSPEPINQPEPPHPVKPPQPQKPFLPKVPPQPELTLHPELLYQEKPLHPQGPFPPKDLSQPEWTPQPEPESLTKFKENLISPITEKSTTIKPIAKPFTPSSHPNPINPSQGITKEPHKPNKIPHTTVKPFVPTKDLNLSIKHPHRPDEIPSPTVKPFVPPKDPKPTTNDPHKPVEMPHTTVKPFVPPKDPKPSTKHPHKPGEIPSTTVKPFVPPKDPKPMTKDPHNPDVIPRPTVKPFVPPKNPKPTIKDPHNPDEMPNPTAKPFVLPKDPKPTTKDPHKPDKITSPTVKPFVPPQDAKPTIKDPHKPDEIPSTTVKPFVPPKDPNPTTKDPQKPDEMPTPTIKPFVPPANPKPINPSQVTTTTAPLIPTSSELSSSKSPGGNNSGKWVWVDE